MNKEELAKWARMILDNERHKTWKFVADRHIGGGGICLGDTKTIIIDPDALTFGLILHEIAHIKKSRLRCKDDLTGHSGIFADEFTRLVNKYCIPKERQENGCCCKNNKK